MIIRNVTSVGFNQVGDWLYTGGEDGFVRIWDARCKALRCQRQHQFQTSVNSVFLHPNGIEIYVADQSGSIYIWDLHTDKLQRLFVTNDGFINSIAYDKECRLLAASDTKGYVYIFRSTPNFCPKNLLDEKNGLMTKSGFLSRRIMFQAHKKAVLKCVFSPDSTILATTSADQTVRFWRTVDLTTTNSTSIVHIDDPFEAVTNDSTGSAFSSVSGSGIHGTSATSSLAQNGFKSAFSNAEAEVVMPSMMDNPRNLMIHSPFVIAMFGLQHPRPPKCFLKPRNLADRVCPVHGNKSVLSFNDTSSIQSNGDTGRSLYHSPSCKQPGYNGHHGSSSLIPLKPNLNSFSQLTWDFEKSGSASKLTDGSGKCL